MSVADDIHIKLSHTYGAFFGAYYTLRPIQAHAIEPILQGRNVLLASCTASGKTEAYTAPLVQRWFSDMKRGLMRVVIVCPTKALVNDLWRRLEVPMQSLGIKTLLRTGDHPHPLKDSHAGLLIVTLESLDSLLARHARLLTSLRAVVLDELHVVDGTARGDQLTVLLERLKYVIKAGNAQAELQRLAATATVGSSREICKKYLGGQAAVIEIPSQRNFQLQIERVAGPEERVLLDAERDDYTFFLERCTVKHILSYVYKTKVRKILVFARSRQNAENLAALLRGKAPFWSAVMVHHSSLSREVRESFEAAFLKAEVAICIATSTLEVGIDIGNVDTVVLVRPPASVASFLQRIGRSNRRSGLVKVLALAMSEAECSFFAHLSASAAQGQLFPETKAFRSSVLCQQSMSLVMQTPRHLLSASGLWSRLPAFLQKLYSPKALTAVMDGLVANEYCTWQGKELTPDDKLYRIFERGTMHHNIPRATASENVLNVVDAENGRIIGAIDKKSLGLTSESSPSAQPWGSLGADINRDRQGTAFSFAGRQREIRQIDNTSGEVIVSNTKEGREQASIFERALSVPKVSLHHARNFAAFLEVPAGIIPWLRVGTDRFLVGHFLGTNGGKLLYRTLKPGSLVGNAFVLMLNGNAPTWTLPELLLSLESYFDKKHLSTLSGLLELGPWSHCLPVSMALADARAQADLPEIGRELTQAHLEEITAGPLADRLLALLAFEKP